MMQILCVTETSSLMALDYLCAIFNKLVIGVGCCSSPVTRMFKEHYETSEDGDATILLFKLFYIFSTVFIVKDMKQLKAITVGIGLVFLTLTLTIGVIHEHQT